MLSIHPLVKNLLWVVGFAEMHTLFRIAFFLTRAKQVPSSLKCPENKIQLGWGWDHSITQVKGTIYSARRMPNTMYIILAVRYWHFLNQDIKICEVFACGHYSHWLGKHWTFTNKQLLLKDLCVCGLWMMLAFRRKKKILIIVYWLFVILYNCKASQVGMRKRNILVYFLDCYKKNVLGRHKCNKYHPVYKGINVCPV